MNEVGAESDVVEEAKDVIGEILGKAVGMSVEEMGEGILSLIVSMVMALLAGCTQSNERILSLAGRVWGGVGAAPLQAPIPPQAPPVKSPFLSYAEARLLSLSTGKQIVFGVGCEPPRSDKWIACRVESLQGYPVPSLVVARPSGNEIYHVSTFVIPELATSGTSQTVAVPPSGSYGSGAAPSAFSMPVYYPPPSSYNSFGSGFGGGMRCVGGVCR